MLTRVGQVFGRNEGIFFTQADCIVLGTRGIVTRTFTLEILFCVTYRQHVTVLKPDRH